MTKIKREDDPEDKELPQGCVETVFTSLVTKKSSRPPPNPGITSSSEAPEGYKYYRGELVRNFKKFKKVHLEVIYFLFFKQYLRM